MATFAQMMKDLDREMDDFFASLKERDSRLYRANPTLYAINKLDDMRNRCIDGYEGARRRGDARSMNTNNATKARIEKALWYLCTVRVIR